jgi:hypothetical protein
MSSCLMALLAAIALSSFIFTADPKGDLSIASVKVSVALYQLRDVLDHLSIFWPMNDENRFIPMIMFRVFCDSSLALSWFVKSIA